jgi:hypothetical protein
MKIFTAHWRHYTDDYYASHNRKMFLNREDADKFLDDLINYDGIDNYYILEETVFDQYSPQTYYYDDDDYYESYHDDEDWYIDEWSMHNSDLAMYKHEEISDMYNKHYHYSWWVGKNVLHTDSMWFTSDEIEGFREIWQRRISELNTQSC